MIKTHFLRYFLLFYGNLIKLRPFSIQQKSDIVSLCVNLLIASTWIKYVLFYLEPVNWMVKQQSLFMIALLAAFLVIFPSVYFINMIYFAFRGAYIVQFLDRRVFRRHSPSSSNSKRIVTGLILSEICLFFIIYSHSLRKIYFGKRDLKALCSLTWTFVMYWHPTIIFYLVHYGQFMTVCAIESLEASIREIPNKFTFEKILHKIDGLAKEIKQLNDLFSLPLFLFLFSNTMDNILTLCSSYLQSLTIPNILFIVMYWLHFFFFAYKEIRIRNSFSRIVAQISETEHISSNLTRQPKLQRNSVELIYFDELNIYKHYFALRLFNLCRLSPQFVLEIALFTLNYVVLITQTQ